MDSSFSNLNKNMINENDCDSFRCSQCSLIPFIKLIFENDKIFIETKCENLHLNKIDINNYLNITNSNSIKCYFCNKKKVDLYYWQEENKFYCNLCKHYIQDKCMSKSKFDSKCKVDLNDYCQFCKKCFKNQCIYCTCIHDNNDKTRYEIITNKEIENIRMNLEKAKDIINEIQNKGRNLYNNILKEFDTNIIEFKEKNEKIIELCSKILDCYVNHMINKNINFQIIQNVKNIIKFKDLNKQLSFQDFINLKNYLIIDTNNNNRIQDNKLNIENILIKSNSQFKNVNFNTNLLTNISHDNSIHNSNQINFSLNNSYNKPKIIASKIQINKNSKNFIEDKNQSHLEKQNNQNEINTDSKNKSDLIIAINETFSSETESNENETQNLKIIFIESKIPLILKINTNSLFKKNQNEKLKKISSEICSLEKRITITSSILNEIFIEYPPLNFQKDKKKNISIVYNKKYEKDESIYSGEINNLTQQKEGRGILIYKNGDYRIGYFHKDKQINKGIQYHLQEESWYEGEFKNNNQEGYGELFWDDNEYFFGQFKNSELSFGNYYYCDGSIYKGPFVDGKKNGIAEYFNPVKNCLEKDIYFKNDEIVKPKKKKKFLKKKYIK